MNKKIYLSMLVAITAAMGVNAQQPAGKELNKEIILEKDFVPVERKVTKKNTLPKVKKVTPPAKTNLDYSTTAVGIDVPTTIPTMMPYGYRTAHNFSNKRGYLEVGGGMQANFDGSAGYRFVDGENTQAGLWIQHNSTWAGKNRTTLITDDAQRAKQVFNDNRGGLYLNQHFNAGTLRLNAGVHFDSFNYYGTKLVGTEYAYEDFDPEKKQSFMEFGVGGDWKGNLNVNDNEVVYRVNVGFNRADYNSIHEKNLVSKGAKENVFNMGIGADYTIAKGTISLDLKGDYMGYTAPTLHDGKQWGYNANKNYFLFTVSPRYKWENDMFRAAVGVDLVLGDINNKLIDMSEDNSKFHFAPALQLDLDITDGAAIFVDLKGGNTINSLSRMAMLDRYSSPAGGITNTWSPVNGEAGFKIGPFSGFSTKLFVGYGIFKGQLLLNHVRWIPSDPSFTYGANQYDGVRMRGFKFGFEANYKYRSLIDVAAKFSYALKDKKEKFEQHSNPNGFAPDKDLTSEWISGYCQGLDNAQIVAGLNLKVRPISKLTVELGADYRGGRSYISETYFMDFDNDVFDVKAGASFRFDKALTLWAKANNILNKKYDILPGQGAQGLCVMGGATIVF